MTFSDFFYKLGVSFQIVASGEHLWAAAGRGGALPLPQQTDDEGGGVHVGLAGDDDDAVTHPPRQKQAVSMFGTRTMATGAF